jgi:uncharacterized membrane protein
MSDALLDLPAKRGRLHALAAAGVLDRSELQRALERLGLRPTIASWSTYLYWHALIIGVVLLAAGAIFFVAANWSALGPFVRMGIVGAGMIGATLIGGHLGDSLAGRASSLLGGLLFGPLLVVYSQIYQTGADAWELFAWWTVVLVAYGLLIRFVGIWVLALLGLHIAWFLWIDQELGVDLYTGKGGLLVPALALVDAVIVALGEWLTKSREREVITHVAAYFGLFVLLPFGVMALVEGQADAEMIPGIVMLALSLLAIWLVYRWRRPAIGMLAAFAGVVTLLTSVFFGRILFEDLDAELFGVAALGVIICAQVWAFTRWLLRWRREQSEHEHAEVQP